MVFKKMYEWWLVRKKISQCLVCVYDEDCKKDLEKYLRENDYIERWAYVENDNIGYLPPLHLYLDFGSRKFLPTKIENKLKEYKLNRSFIDMVLRGKYDFESIFDYAGHPTCPIVSTFPLK